MLRSVNVLPPELIALEGVPLSPHVPADQQVGIAHCLSEFVLNDFSFHEYRSNFSAFKTNT